MGLKYVGLSSTTKDIFTLSSSVSRTLHGGTALKQPIFISSLNISLSVFSKKLY